MEERLSDEKSEKHPSMHCSRSCETGNYLEKNKMNEKLKRCPFCGSEVDFMNLVTPLKMFYCKNHHGCGAVVSFDTPICNRFDKAKIDAWNRREGAKDAGET